LAGGDSRNFQVFDPLDVFAQLTQHISDKGEHFVRYFGWYWHRRRGIRAKEAARDEVKIDRRLVEDVCSAAKSQSSKAVSNWPLCGSECLKSTCSSAPNAGQE